MRRLYLKDRVLAGRVERREDLIEEEDRGARPLLFQQQAPNDLRLGLLPPGQRAEPVVLHRREGRRQHCGRVDLERTVRFFSTSARLVSLALPRRTH